MQDTNDDVVKIISNGKKKVVFVCFNKRGKETEKERQKER